MSTLVKGKRVEELMEGILRDIQVIANDKLMGTATEEQVKGVADAIKEMKEMPSSLPDEAGSVTQTHSGGGHNIANTGPGNTNNIYSQGDRVHSTIILGRPILEVRSNVSSCKIVFNACVPASINWSNSTINHYQSSMLKPFHPEPSNRRCST